MEKNDLSRLLEQVDHSASLHFFEAEGEKVLFRIDGLILTLSDAAFELLEVQRGKPVEKRLTEVSSKFGEAALASALRSLESIAAEGILTDEIEELATPEVEASEPGGILLMLTQTCNLACSYCYAGGGTYGSRTKFLPQDQAESAIDLMLERAQNRKSFTVTFFGGEPLLNFPLLRQVVAYCSYRANELGVSFSFSITTNATAVTDEVVEFFKENRFTVMVSYDGVDAQRKNRPFNGGKESDPIVRENIRRMVEAGIPIQIRATLVRDMVHKEGVSDLLQIGTSLGVKKITLSPVSTTKNSLFPANEDLTLEVEDHRRLQSIYREASEENLARACEGIEEPVRFDPHLHLTRALAKGEAVGMGRCGACFGMSAVSTEGKIYPCHRFVGMDEYAIGSLDSGFSTQKVKDFFESAYEAGKEKCSPCWVRLMCTGGCYYHNADGRGGFLPPEDSACDDYREMVKYSILQLLRLRSLPSSSAARFMSNTKDL